jgi:hypothetical protein
VENEPTVGMAALKAALPVLPDGAFWDECMNGPTLRIAAGSADRKVALSFRLAVSDAVEALHVGMVMSAKDLLLGEKEWDDGRVLICWVSEGENGPIEIDPVASVRGSQRKEGISLVTAPSFGAGYPVVVIENLATSGEMTISALELTPVRHRPSWRWMRWVLGACWFSWLFACLSGSSKVSLPRRAAAAALWVVMGALFAFPGPWERIYPLLIPYDLGASMETRDGPSFAVKPPVPETKTPQGIASQGALGKIPEQGGWIIQIRSHLKRQRLLLHTGFVVGITVLFSYLVGSRRAAWLAGGLVLAMEAAQIGFGYSFDFGDFMDLACGAAGITIGWLLFGKLNRWSSISRWMALPAAEPAPPSIAGSAPDERKA